MGRKLRWQAQLQVLHCIHQLNFTPHCLYDRNLYLEPQHACRLPSESISCKSHYSNIEKISNAEGWRLALK